MNELLLKLWPYLRGRMSTRGTNILSTFGSLSMLMLTLHAMVSYQWAKDVFFVLSGIFAAIIPLAFCVSWLFELKHAWDMRVVAIIPVSGEPFPQNYLNAKKLGYMNTRKPTIEESKKWGLYRRRRLLETAKRLWYVTNEELEKQQIEERLSDPDTPIEEFMRIRNEQEQRRKENPS